LLIASSSQELTFIRLSTETRKVVTESKQAQENALPSRYVDRRGSARMDANPRAGQRTLTLGFILAILTLLLARIASG
jgi:hypothetical protein